MKQQNSEDSMAARFQDELDAINKDLAHIEADIINGNETTLRDVRFSQYLQSRTIILLVRTLQIQTPEGLQLECPAARMYVAVSKWVLPVMICLAVTGVVYAAILAAQAGFSLP